ncbi:DUF5959 family protein [Streptomyces sp. NBC_00250]|uniref:DUF5959 family protein n=1 Tax=Streptomyces sp. NBC_00250 TaxID=2903641 RepID=UPI002E2E4737|nr:DUF5959 family protein [Streptomyces sp. NBC_00250]
MTPTEGSPRSAQDAMLLGRSSPKQLLRPRAVTRPQHLYAARQKSWVANTLGRDMEDRERFTLLRITGKYGGSVAIELDESGASGIPDTSGELIVHNDFVAGLTRTYVEPYDLAPWEHVLDEVEAGRDAVWREHARVAEIGIQLVDREDDQDQITVTVADQQTTRVAISMEVNRGWIEEQRELLHGIREAWKHVHPTALR